MSDMLAIAQSGVRAYARALEAVADNVANAATPGHVRRTTNLSPASIGGGQGPLELDPVGGSGVRLTGISRAADLLGADTVRRADSSVAALETTDRWLSAVQAALTGPNALAEPMNALFGSLSDLANDPGNPAVRQSVLAKADTLAGRFNGNAATLMQIDKDLLTEAETETRSLNSLVRGLADINAQLRRATSGSGAGVVLADERDRLLSKMSGYIAFEVRFDARGQASVRVPDAGGPLLVAGEDPEIARLVPSPLGFELRIGPTGNDAPASLLGGTLAGLSIARTLVNQTRLRLDSLAERTASDLNVVHRNGIDLNGMDGGDLFSTRASVAESARGNGGSARISAALADGANPPAMLLTFDGTSWTLARADNSAFVAGGLPLVLDGVTVDGAGAAANGDQFRIGTGAGAAGFALRPLIDRDIAAAARWSTDAGPTNSGGGRLDVRLEAALPIPATPPFVVTAMAGGLLELTDGAGLVLAFGAPGDWLAGDGFAVRISGQPAEGDSFTIARTGPDDGSNGNALALLGLRDAASTSGTLGDVQDALVSSISVPLAETRSRADAARGSRDSAAEALNDSSGVDLNTEAADMLRLQQAYQANARLIQTAREVFDAILSAAR